MDNKIAKTRRRTQSKDNKRKRDIKPIEVMDKEVKKSKPQMSGQFVTINRLSIDFFVNKSCIELSKALLGQILCRKVSPNGPIVKAMIVETEAYLGSEDKASATYNGRRTEHLEPLYMSCGTCFVYMTYGMYHCINISAKEDGEGVLLRAGQPLEGIDSMQTLRAKSRKIKTDKPFDLKVLTNGPSKLCMSLDINKNMNKEDITNSDLIWVESGPTVHQNDIICAKRIGIQRAPKEWSDKLFRFYIKDNGFVSQT